MDVRSPPTGIAPERVRLEEDGSCTEDGHTVAWAGEDEALIDERVAVRMSD